MSSNWCDKYDFRTCGMFVANHVRSFGAFRFEGGAAFVVLADIAIDATPSFIALAGGSLFNGHVLVGVGAHWAVEAEGGRATEDL